LEGGLNRCVESGRTSSVTDFIGLGGQPASPSAPPRPVEVEAGPSPPDRRTRSVEVLPVADVEPAAGEGRGFERGGGGDAGEEVAGGVGVAVVGEVLAGQIHGCSELERDALTARLDVLRFGAPSRLSRIRCRWQRFRVEP
jgi:hypothetical protein